MNKLKDIKIWNKAMDLTVEVYDVTSTFPKDERFGLISQIRRAAVSIPSNIAEGAGRNSLKEFNNFLGIANGSCFELQTQLLIANKLLMLNSKDLESLLTQIDELQKMTYGFQKMLQQKIEK
ncbi:four helix bundle protein [Pedobacter sp. UYEF25]